MSIFFILYLLCVWGFVALALYLPKHQTQVYQKSLSSQQAKLLRMAGYLLLVASLILAMIFYNISIGICYWIGALTLAAFTLAWILSYQSPRFFNLLFVISGLTVVTGLIL